MICVQLPQDVYQPNLMEVMENLILLSPSQMMMYLPNPTGVSMEIDVPISLDPT